MITLKEHFSWSQKSLWNSSKYSYWKKYFLGLDSGSNIRFEKGNEIGKFLEVGGDADSFSTDEKLAEVAAKVPKLDIMEDELIYYVNDKKILSYVDSASITNDFFLEYKSGKEPWTQERVDEHGQLPFYALGYWLKSGKTVIPSCQLIWIETEDHHVFDTNGNKLYTEVKYTGRVEIFNRDFIAKELVEMYESIAKDIKDIEEYEHLEIELEEDVVSDYIEWKEIKENAEDMMSEIKKSVLAEMNDTELGYASTEDGKFSKVTKKSYTYSESLQEIEKDFKAKLNKLKKWEVKQGIAKASESSYLTFKSF